MSCAAGKANFRLLDPNIGWSASSADGLAGLNDAAGIYLAQTVAGALDPCQILPYLPPARLARGCGECDWYLVTPAPPQSQLLVRDACHSPWQPVWHGTCVPAPLVDPVAVATWSDRLAIADRGANVVRVFGKRAATALAIIRTPAPGPIAFSPSGDLLVSSPDSAQLLRFGLGGDQRRSLAAPLPASGKVLSIAVDATDRVWVVEDLSGSWTLWSAACDAAQFTPATIADLHNAFPPSGLLTASSEGFCFDQDTRQGLGVATCFSWYGRPLASGSIVAPPPPRRQTQGQLLTGMLDSGIPRCEWHRVQLDADIPPRTTLTMAVATSEDPAASPQGDGSRESGWMDFPAGVPHPSDWSSSPSGSTDFLIDQPAGRYLYFRLRFSGNGIDTPRVRRVRFDFPRVTSLDHMPDVYRATPKAEDFTKRFLALFDASIADLDSVIQRYPALLDPSGVPGQMLPWLGGFFGIGFDPTWSDQKRRAILAGAPSLYRQRGTAQGLKDALKLVFAIDSSIDERPSAGPWGSVAGNVDGHTALGSPARVGAVRLFGRSSARFYLDRSALGKAPLRSYGNPDQDPFSDGAYRFDVLVPPLPDQSADQVQRLTNLVRAQSPAHTVASVRVGGTGFLLGTWSTIGVDTAFVPLAAPILGSGGNVRLNRMSVLWGQSGSPARGAAVGRTSVVGRKRIAG